MMRGLAKRTIVERSFYYLWRRKLVEQLPQLQPCIFQRVRVVTPVAPARGNRLDGYVQGGDLSQVLENLGVFVVLNAVTDGLKAYSGGGFGRGDRTWWIEKYSVPRSSQTAAACGRIHVVPTADAVPGAPSVGAIVKNPRRSFRPIQEPCLDALVDRRIVHHPFRSVAEPRVATGIAPEIAPSGKRQSGPLLHGIEQSPMVDG